MALLFYDSNPFFQLYLPIEIQKMLKGGSGVGYFASASESEYEFQRVFDFLLKTRHNVTIY
jgi:hypothetical protein